MPPPQPRHKRAARPAEVNPDGTPVTTPQEEERAAWRRLLEAGRKNNEPYDSTDWVLDHLDTKPRDIDSKGVPNAGLVTMLKHLKKDEESRTKFLQESGKQMAARQKERLKASSDEGQISRWTEAEMSEIDSVLYEIRRGADGE